MENMEDLRLLIKLKNIPMWKVAERVGISEPTFFRWLRAYDSEHHQKIMTAIKELETDDQSSSLKIGSIKRCPFCGQLIIGGCES